MEDAKIVELYLQREESAIAHTAEKYGTRLRYIANNILDDPPAAEECENDTYLQAWNSIPPHTPFDYLFAYLARITRHFALDTCKSRSRAKRDARIVELTQEMNECLASSEDVEAQMDARALGAAISAFLYRLPQQQRDIFLRRYWYFESVAQIAKRFAITQSKVKITLFRLRNQLREYLEKEGFVL